MLSFHTVHFTLFYASCLLSATFINALFDLFELSVTVNNVSNSTGYWLLVRTKCVYKVKCLTARIYNESTYEKGHEYIWYQFVSFMTYNMKHKKGYKPCFPQLLFCCNK